MPWRAVARREVRGLRGPRTVKYGLAAVALVFVLGGYLVPITVPEPTTTDYAGYMSEAVTLVLPLTGLLLGYKTIVGDRASGRLALLLSLPHGRREVVLGKFVGRGAVLVGTVLAGVVGGVALVDYPYGSLEPLVAVGYLAVTAAYGLAFVGIGMAVSTVTTSGRLATAGAFGVFFLFVVVWGQLRGPLLLGLEYLGLADGRLPAWALFVYGLEPGLLYRRVLDGVFAGQGTGPYLGPDAAWYLGGWPALLLLLAWVPLPVVLGSRRFERTDL